MVIEEFENRLDELNKMGAIEDRKLLKVIARMLLEILKKLDD